MATIGTVDVDLSEHANTVLCAFYAVDGVTLCCFEMGATVMNGVWPWLMCVKVLIDTSGYLEAQCFAVHCGRRKVDALERDLRDHILCHSSLERGFVENWPFLSL